MVPSNAGHGSSLGLQRMSKNKVFSIAIHILHIIGWFVFHLLLFNVNLMSFHSLRKKYSSFMAGLREIQYLGHQQLF